MRAILFLTDAPAVPFDSCRHTGLMPVLDRPFVHHVVESLVDRGIDAIDFILDDAASNLEESLGNGERWGCRFRYHVPLNADRVGELFWVMGLEREGDILIGRGDCLPSLPSDLRGLFSHPISFLLESSRGALDGNGSCIAFMTKRNPGALEWTGWCLTSGRCLAGLPVDSTQNDLTRYLLGRSRRVEVEAGVSVRRYQELVAANMAVLRSGSRSLLFAGREVKPGVFVARSARISRSAELIAPVYVGEDAWVGANARLGPDAVIGSECVIDSEVTVADSVVMSGSYVGVGLDVRNAIVDGECFVSLAVGHKISVGDDVLLSRAVPAIGKSLLELLPRLVAAVVFIALAPVLALGKLLRWIVSAVRAIGYRNVPTHGSDRPDCAQLRPGLSDLFFRVLPSLPMVAMGSVSFVGPTMERQRGSGATSGSRPGLITEAMVKCAPDASPEELGVVAECYRVRCSPWYDLKLVGAYCAAALTGKAGVSV